MIIPRYLSNQTIDTNAFCKLIEISKKEFIERYDKAAKYSRYKESVFIKHIDLKNSIALSEKLFQFPGFLILASVPFLLFCLLLFVFFLFSFCISFYFAFLVICFLLHFFVSAVALALAVAGCGCGHGCG